VATLATWYQCTLGDIASGGKDKSLCSVGILALIWIMSLVWPPNLALLSGNVQRLVWLGPELVGRLWWVCTLPGVLVVRAIWRAQLVGIATG
jgi:hypothetical protein